MQQQTKSVAANSEHGASWMAALTQAQSRLGDSPFWWIWASRARDSGLEGHSAPHAGWEQPGSTGPCAGQGHSAQSLLSLYAAVTQTRQDAAEHGPQ